MSEILQPEYKHFIIDEPNQWAQGVMESTYVNKKDALTLSTLLDMNQPKQLEVITGIATDHTGQLFAIEPSSGVIYRFFKETGFFQKTGLSDSHSNETMDHSCDCPPGRFRFMDPDGNNYGGDIAFGSKKLYVADTYHHRIQVFHLPGYQLSHVIGRVERCLPKSGSKRGELNTPTRIAVDSHNILYVLDEGNHRIQKFDRYGSFLEILDDPSSQNRLTWPVDFTLDCKDIAYVIEKRSVNETSCYRVDRYDPMGSYLDTPIDFGSLNLDFQPSVIAIDNQRIYVGGIHAEAFLIHRFDKTGHHLGCFGITDKPCMKLILSPNGELFGAFNSSLFHLNASTAFESKGVYFSRDFDSTITNCKWHRLVLDTYSKENAELIISFKTWDTERERCFTRFSVMAHVKGSSPPVLDMLFPKTKGKYLRLKFEFFSEGAGAYEINNIKIIFERLSYLRYLPAIYQQDEKSRLFLERFLSIFETLVLETEQTIEKVHTFFDPESVEGAFLDWLSGWLAITPDKNWPEEKRKAHLMKAYSLYKSRGTRKGLEDVISLFTMSKPIIIEHRPLKAPMVIGVCSVIGETTVVGRRFPAPLVLDETSTIGQFALKEAKDPAHAPLEAGIYEFTVLSNTENLSGKNEHTALKNLVRAESPAHTRPYLITSENAAMQLGVHAFLEINTRLSKGALPMRVGVQSQLGEETFLGTRHLKKGSMGSRSKIATDTLLH